MNFPLPVRAVATAAGTAGTWCSPGWTSTAWPGGCACRPAWWRKPSAAGRWGGTTCLPVLVLRPSARTGHCPFLEGSGCAVHPARPLACALYPLGQSIDPVTAKTEYFPQLPLCGAPAPGRTLADYLENSGVIQRAGTDASWSVECTRISGMLTAAGGREHPRFLPAVRRVERALYYDYSTGDEFYPQFRANLEKLYPVLQALLAAKSE